VPGPASSTSQHHEAPGLLDLVTEKKVWERCTKVALTDGHLAGRQNTLLPSSKGRTGISLMRRPEIRVEDRAQIWCAQHDLRTDGSRVYLAASHLRSFCGVTPQNAQYGGAGDRAIQSFDSVRSPITWEPRRLCSSRHSELLGFFEDRRLVKPERCCIRVKLAGYQTRPHEATWLSKSRIALTPDEENCAPPMQQTAAFTYSTQQ